MNLIKKLLILIVMINPVLIYASGGEEHGHSNIVFPTPLESYNDSSLGGISEILGHRIEVSPFNLAASLIFLLAIIHTFLTPSIRNLSHKLKHHHAERLKNKEPGLIEYLGDIVDEVSFFGEFTHFLGEVEAVFGIWVLVLMGAITYFFNWSTVLYYMSNGVNFTEPMFVVVIMTLASTRPIVILAENALRQIAKIGKGSPAAWWMTILIVGPMLGSFITEPGAMTISAMLLANQFYKHEPSSKFAYATIGLLFVNVSVGGVFTHFAAPPVLMVAGKWGWGMEHMILHYGWKAASGIIISTLLYYLIFRNEFKKLKNTEEVPENACPVNWEDRKEPIPVSVTLTHVFFLAWTVFNAHNPVLFVGGFLFYLGFAQSTQHHQNRLNLRSPLLVGFFLAGLVIHGGVQAWWIAPILGSLDEFQLLLGATFLTSFNDNAAITYLSSLVPTFTVGMKYAVVAGAVAGGGMTVIANAPNPAGQSILQKYFANGVAPLWLAVAATVPTLIMVAVFWLLPSL
jgi:hypothetical protein